jgi:hypothetical protein
MGTRHPYWHSRTGWVTSFIPDPNNGLEPRYTSVAEGVTADEAGNVYGAEVLQKRMRKYIPKRYSATPPQRN